MKQDDDDKFPYVEAMLLALPALALGFAILYFTGGLNLIVGREFGKFQEESRRQIQEESRGYQTGMVINLDRLCLEWETSGNDAIAASIRQRSADFTGELPEHVEECVDDARRTR